MTLEISDKDIRLFRDLIREKSGMDLQGSRLDALRSGLYTRMESMGIADPNRYYSFLHHDPTGKKELEELLSYITINETYFFRNAAHFAALRDHVLVKSIRENKNGILRIWSAGCSTGEEPYSIAMTVLSLMQDQEDLKIEILGTDVDKEAIAKAERGLYGKRTLRVTEEKYRNSYFSRNNGKFEIADKLRDITRFEYFNLMETLYPRPSQGDWDIIFCRNVVIYFDRESVRHVVNGFNSVLADNGYLFMGHSEALDGISRDFSPVEISGAFVYVKKPYGDIIAENEKVRRRGGEEARQQEDDGSWKVKPLEQEWGAELIHTRSSELLSTEVKLQSAQEEDAESMYTEASELLAEGRIDEALSKIEIYMELNPEDARGHLLTGIIYGDRGLYEWSIGEFEKCIEIEPLLTQAHHLLGVVYQTSGQTAEAIDEFKKAIYIDKGCVLSHFGLARTYHANQMKADAVREYSNTLKILGKMEDDEILEFSGGLTVRILMQTCLSKIEELS